MCCAIAAPAANPAQPKIIDHVRRVFVLVMMNFLFMGKLPNPHIENAAEKTTRPNKKVGGAGDGTKRREQSSAQERLSLMC
jgi:hypothetical protein